MLKKKKPFFIKLTTAQHYHVQTSDTNFHTTQTVNTDSTDKNSHTSP
jgi:hypothetical protein